MKIKNLSILVLFLVMIFHTFFSCSKNIEILKVTTYQDFQTLTDTSHTIIVMKDLDIGGEFDLFGDGALILVKKDTTKPFAKTTEFNDSGCWTSTWQDFNDEIKINKIIVDMLIYGNPIDMHTGWKKFSGNPVLSGENTLLPLNEKNITKQTILVPDPPGGVPQDQSIIRGKKPYEGKWLLFFNHTPHKWPFEYYWSFVVADSLSPLKKGINPFVIPDKHFPLFGPIDNQAPNDWIEINGTYYAPDETYQSMSHLWTSTDLFNWEDKGVIKNKVGHDPGICFDGEMFHLFNEHENKISHCFLDIEKVMAYHNKDVLDVGDHTGDADVSFFNNQWHMFVDDGVHLHYKISHAVTDPDKFPYAWSLTPEIYGPHTSEQNQNWDDDTKEGNDFGTGDADIALEGTTLYLFTERPVGVAYKELVELYDDTDQNVDIMVEWDSDLDGKPDSETTWKKCKAGCHEAKIDDLGTGNRFRLKIKMRTTSPNESPLIRNLKILYEHI